MTTRNIANDGQYQLLYDADIVPAGGNRVVEVKKNNATVAQFTGVYPEPVEGTAIPLRGTGGKRVKSVEGGAATLFVGGHYEVKGSEITKYYFAGATRIATPALAPGASVRKYTIPQNMTVEYILGDHVSINSTII